VAGENHFLIPSIPEFRVLAGGQTFPATTQCQNISELPELWYRARKPPAAKQKEKRKDVNIAFPAEESKVHPKSLLASTH
jgi:hypothetical protein